MKHASFLLIILCFLSYFQVAGFVHNEKISFEPISIEGGLPSNEIRKLYQDKEGYLWISTYSGLVRYDGYNYVAYKTVNTPQKQLINSYVNSVVEDANHNLWIATHNGLYVLCKTTEIITKIDFPILSNCRIEAVVPARNGDIWVATNRGLFCQLNSTGEFQYCIGNKWHLESTDMKSLMEDKDGFLWIGTWSGGLIRYDINERRAYRYSSIQALRSSHTLFQDKDGNIWIGTWGEGLVKLINPYDMNKLSHINYKHVSNNRSSLSDDIIYAISQDLNTGKIWVGSRSGLSILNDPDDPYSFSNYMPENDGGNLPFNEVNSIICTKDNTMWLGMLGGGVYSVNTNKLFKNNDPMLNVRNKFCTSSVKSIYSEKKGEFWIGLAGFGLILYNQNTGRFVRYNELPEFNNMNPISTVNAISYRTKTDEIYFATEDDGVWIYNNKKKQVRSINNQTERKIVDNCVYTFLEDSKNNFWVGMRSDVGILLPDDRFIPLNELLAPDQSQIKPSYVFDIVEDKNDNIWVATNNNGIFRITGSKQGKTIKNYSPSNKLLFAEGVLCMFVDHKNRVWAGTESGLMLYHASENIFLPFENKMYSYRDIISNIMEDRNHHLWITTNMGIMELVITNDKIEFSRSYTTNDGLLDNYFNRNSSFMTVDGNILFGGYHGLSSTPSDNKTGQFDNSAIVITDFKIFNKSVHDFEVSDRKKISPAAIGYTDKITLSHDKNNFNIDFSLLNYKNISKNRYAYKLDGYDEDWIYADTKRHFAYYNNLKAGIYTFHVRGANSNNVWSSAEETLQIEIFPPPWLSWKAYVVYVMIVILLAYTVYRMLTNKIKLKRELEIGEINRKRIEEVNHAKLQFFTNITHELLTPLSIISASVEQLKTADTNKPEYNLITNNVTRLMRLIQQILEFRKAESGNLKLRVSEGNIALFLESCVNAFQPLAKKQKLTFIFESKPKQIMAFFDPDKFDKIIYNLLSNAAKYNKENGEVRVGIKKRENHVIINIKDTGTGMNQEELKNIFQRFYEGDYRKHHTIGTGIGLSLVKNLVDIHHGVIEVQSVKNEGTTFTVTIPVAKSGYSEDEIDQDIQIVNENILNINDTEIVSEEIVRKNDNKNSIRILIAEDNEELLWLLKRYFQTEYLIFAVKSAEEAIDVLQKEDSINLIISDIMMQGMDGYEFCSFIKNKFEYCHIPVILITAKQVVDDAITGYECGADSYVTKPLNLALLDAQIKNLIKKQQRMSIDFRKQLVFNVKELNYTSMDEIFIQQAIDCVNNHLDDPDFNQIRFVDEMNTSRTTLTDKLKNLTGLTPSAFINNIRLNTASRIINEKGKVRTSDLAFAVGFNDPKYFSTLFKKKFGVSPTDYVRKNL
jgi:signal transduction histidine kinase/ligand-binding sensor domain-containing protein/AraC-like DNA-binding protein